MTENRSKILFVNNSSSLAVGTTRSLLFLLKHLKSKYSLGVAAFPDSESMPSVLLDQEISYHRLGFFPFASLRRLVRIIREANYELVYANNFDKRSRDAFFAAKLTGRRFIWHIRDPVRKKWYRCLLKYADAVIANSRDTADEIKAGSGFESPTVILNGIDPSEFGRDRAEVRREVLQSLNWPESTFLIVNVGALCSLKNQADAVTITGLVGEKFPEARLICLGAPVEEGYPEKLWELIKQHGLSDKVRLLGAQLNVSDYLCGGDALLHTDKRFPPFGRGIMEAMAASLPVVAYCVREIPEIIEKDRTAFLIPPGDTDGAYESLCRLIADPDLRKKMGYAAHARVTQFFTAADTARQVDSVITSVLQKKRSKFSWRRFV